MEQLQRGVLPAGHQHMIMEQGRAHRRGHGRGHQQANHHDQHLGGQEAEGQAGSVIHGCPTR